jgi:hypothetical protein
MKFLKFVVYDAPKMAEIVTVSTKLMANSPKGYRVLSTYVCMSPPFYFCPV